MGMTEDSHDRMAIHEPVDPVHSGGCREGGGRPGPASPLLKNILKLTMNLWTIRNPELIIQDLNFEFRISFLGFRKKDLAAYQINFPFSLIQNVLSYFVLYKQVHLEQHLIL